LNNSSRFALVAALGLICMSTVRAGSGPAEVLVFAASSLQTSLDTIAGPAERLTGVRMKVSYAASSALARQIENGAPAEIFIAADTDWMDYLATRRLLQDKSRVNLLGNRLVLIAHRTRAVELSIEKGFPIAKVLGRERLALADPSAVPAGKYAKAALTHLGVWDAVAGRVAAAENVRAALQLVSRGEAPLGIVYRSDALDDANVVIVDTFPDSTHPPITYPIALTTTASPAATRIVEFLQNDLSREIFERHGFTKPSRN